MSDTQSNFPTVGVARRVITPPAHVELAGLGYYLQRTPERVRDDLTATALVIHGSGNKTVAFVALDLMYADERFAAAVRRRAATETGIHPSAICINCSHSHNAPNAAFVRGVGELDETYVQSVVMAASDAIIEAQRKSQPAKLYVGGIELAGYTFNRTREGGPVDTHLAVLRADTADGKPLAVAFNFHTHLTAHMEIDLRAVSRDWSGEVIDKIEAALPGVMALYLQGTCGDVMLSPEFNSTERRFEPAEAISRATREAYQSARQLDGSKVSWATMRIKLPTRRWTYEEISRDREEALRRLETGDTTDWLKGFARVIVTYPDRLPRRYGGSVEKTVAAVSRFAVEWTDAILADLATRPEWIETEVQAIRIDDVFFCAHSSELFSTLGLEIRRRWPKKDLFILGYSNGSLGYLPDAYDVKRRSYAADQSPKFTGQFPFTEDSGTVMVAGLVNALHKAELENGL